MYKQTETITATKQAMELLLPKVAKSQITPDGVEGKYAALTYEGRDQWDVWVRHTNCDSGEVLTERKLSAIIKAIGLPVFKLTGEALLEMTTAQVLQFASVLGLKARRSDSKEVSYDL